MKKFDLYSNFIKIIPKSPINNHSALVQIMARRQSDDKPLSEHMTVRLTDTYMRHSVSMSKPDYMWQNAIHVCEQGNYW